MLLVKKLLGIVVLGLLFCGNADAGILNKSYEKAIKKGKLKIDDKVKEKKDLEKIILCDVQIEIYPELEKSFLNLLHNSGYPDVKFEKKVDFEQLYNQRLN